ncbi:hypothetical protein CC86DRAFT_138645 [Ophiobolus disseminans]|uniref:Uncharacterized protein n=1 Tax=Ophiobolus disseminans TaxID=1469910 RepID=A0A6A7ADS9_9PLEO|nr:hypothetical protein CC86DRAFT_138645 [Ophiobolus disseminans]
MRALSAGRSEFRCEPFAASRSLSSLRRRCESARLGSGRAFLSFVLARRHQSQGREMPSKRVRLSTQLRFCRL